MKTSTRLPRLFWLAAVVLWVAVALFPPSTGLTRAGGLGLALVIWFGLIGLYWQRATVRYSLLALTLLGAGFLALPARGLPPVEELRGDYIKGLQRYEGVTYWWGGESPKGIDCSGLIRRGLIDSLFLRGIRSLDPGLVRHSLWLWWHDCTANDLGEGRYTTPVCVTKSINALDHSKILPGDLAVTGDGVHIMAYLGHERWIEADPGLDHVVTVAVQSKDNFWFSGPMKIVRWNVLKP